jgi:hypothetical protein
MPAHAVTAMCGFGNNFMSLSFRKGRFCDHRKKSGDRRNRGARGIDVGILDKVDGAPGRTRTSTDVNPPDFESGASTNSATGAYRRSKGRRRTARIIAKRPAKASHRPAAKHRSGMDRASRSRPLGRRRESNSNKNSILDYSKNTFYIMPSI